MQEQEFVLVGSQGTFAVPPGESRIGSDAACQICIRGDGVLPVHAYLRMDAGKLLIRPADVSESKGDSGGRVAINGKPVNGPVLVGSGQEVAIGNVQMRVLVSGKKAPPLWSRRWFRTSVYSAAGVALAMFAAYLYVAFFVLDERTLIENIKAIVKSRLLRDDTEISSVQVRMFEGSIQITDLRIKDKYNLSSSAKPFIRVPSIKVKLDMWPLLISGMRDFRNVDLIIDHPEVNIDRAKNDGTLSIDDILEKWRRGSGRLDIDNLDFHLQVTSGSVHLRDGYTNIGETSLENIDLALRGPGASSPISIERCSMTTTASNAKAADEGALKLSGSVHLFDPAYRIEASRITSDDLQLEMKNFDLARLFEHFGYAWQPYRADFKVVLGKPLTGTVNVELRGLQELRTHGKVWSESLISLREEKQMPLGNIPMTLEWDTNLIDDGKGYSPHDLSVDLKGGPATDAYLAFKALGKRNPGGTSNYTLNFECRLQDLLSTDVGKRLGLDGTMGGRLKGTGTLLREASGSLKIDASMESIDGYVDVVDPADLAKPAAQRKPAVRQVLPLRFDCHMNADPNPAGAISYVNIASFSLAAPSFEAHSNTESGIVKGLGPDEKLDAHAQFILKLKGRDFFVEFAPILKLFGFTRPIEEIFDLKVTVVTNSERDGVVSIAAEGTSARQWGPDSAPVQLLALLEYDVNAKARSGGAAPPYLTLGLRVASEKELPLEVRMRAVCSRDERAERIVIEGFEPDASMLINSDVNTLRERFAPYIESWLRSYDESRGLADKGWLSFYRDTQLSGAVEQSGRIVIERMLSATAPEPDRVSFDLNFTAKDFNLNVPLENAKGRAGQTDGRFAWTEPNPKLRIKGEYLQRLSTNKEEPHRERLNIQQMEVNGRLGGFQLALSDLDLFKLANLPALPNQTWTDVLAAMNISGQIHPAAYDFLRGTGVLTPRDPVSGNVALQVSFDRQKDALALEKFVFKQDEQHREFPLTVLDVNGSLLRVRDLSSRLFPVKEAPPFSERLAAFIDEGGPAAMLDHLGDDLSVNQMQLETAPLIEWLKREQKIGDENRVVPPLIASLRNRDWEPEGTWKIAGLKLSRVGDARKRSWKLVAGMLRNDLSIFGSTPAGGGERPTVFRFTNDWNLQLGLSLSEDNSVGLVGDIHLDDAYIAASVPRLKYEYRKPAKEPCGIEISEFAYAHGLLAQVGRLRLTGKPLSLDLKDLKADWTGPAKGTVSVGEMVVNGGPFPCVVILNKYEPGSDTLNLRISAPELDLSWLAQIGGLPPMLQGRLKDVSASYKGSLISLQAMSEREPAQLATRYKLNADDARLSGLNPETDVLNLDGKMDGVNVLLPLGPEQTLVAKLNGQAKLTTRDLAFKELSADIASARDGQPATKLSFTAPRLNINALDARLNLLRAARATGVPLDVNGTLIFGTPIKASDTVQSLHQLLGLAGAAAATDAPGERRFTVFEKLALSGSMKIPSLQLERTALTNVDIQNFSLKALKLSYSALAADAYGGHAVISDADNDLTKGRTVEVDGKPAIKGIAHEEKLALIDAELGQLLAISGSQGFALGGKVTAQHGTLKGSDFWGVDRLSWNGAIKFRVSGITVAAPQRQAGAGSDKLPPWMLPVGGAYGEAFADGFRTGAASETVSARELWSDKAGDAARPQQALMLALHAYLSKLIGFESDKLEFEAIEPTVEIDKGSAKITSALQLVGKGSCDGLELTVKNLRVNLATEAFNDDAGEGLIIYPTAIPRSARTRLHLEKWPAAVQTEYLKAVTQGNLPLRVYGQLAAPVFKFPWADVQIFGRRALFDMDRIADLESLARARQNLVKQWGVDAADVERAAAVADRLGVGLPGTQTARDMGESCIERVTGLPQSLFKLLSKTTPVITPVNSLQQLMNPEPDPVPPGTKSKEGADVKKNP